MYPAFNVSSSLTPFQNLPLFYGELSVGTLKQVPLSGEGVLRFGQAVAARARKSRAVARRISGARQTMTEPVTALVSQAVVELLGADVWDVKGTVPG